jgi:hypothetical protein
LEKIRAVLNLREKNLEKLVENNAIPAKKMFCVWRIHIEK